MIRIKPWLAALVAAAAVVAAASPALAADAIPGQRWTAQPGQAFNDGWQPLSTSATYLPCQTVRWSFDRSGEDPGRATMVNDVRAALAALQPLTGLTFTEVASGAPADLVYRWGDLAAEGHPDAAGFGGFTGPGKGFVSFDTKADWTLDKWAGWDWRHLEWPRPDLGPGWYSWKDGPGRVALAVHETMHALGFGHVADFTSIMYPQGGLPNNQGRFSPGDLAGLRAMYLDRPCGSASATASATASAAPSASGVSAPDTATGVTLQKTARGARVVSSSVSDTGVLSATVKTSLARGSTVTIDVTTASGGKASMSRTVRSGGVVQFTHAITGGSTVDLRDGRGRLLMSWRASG